MRTGVRTILTAGPTMGGLLLALLATTACSTLPMGRDKIVRAPVQCADQTAQIYFEPESADVTPESRAVIAQAAASAKGCTVRAVSVMGLADSVGDPTANLELSKRRAQSVTAALAAAGLPEAEFQVSAAGQAGATNARGEAAPLRRRADVVLHLAPAR